MLEIYRWAPLRSLLVPLLGLGGSEIQTQICLTPSWEPTIYGLMGGSRDLQSLMPIERCHVAAILAGHPTRPNPDPLLDFYRDVDCGKFPRVLHPKAIAEATWQLRSAMELRSLLRSQGRLEDVEWMSGFIDKLSVIRDRHVQKEQPEASFKGYDSRPTRNGPSSSEEDASEFRFLKSDI